MLTCLAIALLALVLAGVSRAIFESHRPWIKPFNEDTKQAYVTLIFAAVVLLAWVHRDNLHLNSLEGPGGWKASFQEVNAKVDTLADQLKEFFKNRKTESFDSHNWKNRVRRVSYSKDHGFVLEVTLEQEPIPGSVEVDEGAIVLTHEPKIDGKKIQFEANSDEPDDTGLTVTYSYLPPKN